jgi:lipoate-protein ligase A
MCHVLLESVPQNGQINMDIDESLLEQTIHEPITVLRFYRWAEPTLSLGHFQKESSENVPESCAKLARVKRLSGGGAILHHHEWTYSLVIPAQHPFAMTPTALYDIVHEIWIKVGQDLNIQLKPRGKLEAEKEGQFLCYLRGDPHDVMLGEHKIVGSAQRRRKGAVLQHGSFLWKQSEYLPQIPGVSDFTQLTESNFVKVPNLFLTHWSPQIADSYIISAAK